MAWRLSARCHCRSYTLENKAIIELKAVERLMPIHEAQLITYLKLSGIPTGLLLNFHTAVLREGIRRLTR